MIHTIKGFGKVNEAEIVVFLDLSGFFDDVGREIALTEKYHKSYADLTKSLNFYTYCVSEICK